MIHRAWLRRVSLFVIVLLAGACDKAQPPVQTVRPVLTAVIGSDFGEAGMAFSGEVRSRHETPLAFRIPGKVSARLVDAGTVVKAGEALARLDPADTTLSASSAKAQLDLAEAELRRYRELRTKNFVSQAALDAKETSFKAAQAQADLANNQSSYTLLRADKAGVVEQVTVDVGQVVAAGQTVMRVVRTDMLEVGVSIPESRMTDVRLRKVAEVTLWADDKAMFKGELRELSPVADPVTRTYAARVSILNPDARVLLGMTANVRFLDDGSGKLQTKPLSVPLSAIFQQEGKPALWVVASDQTVSLRPVVVSSFGETSATLTGGVAAGERIVIAGVHKLSAGEKISAVDQAPAR